MSSIVCKGLNHLLDELEQGCGVMLVAEEALGPVVLPKLRDYLDEQPAWSDISIVLLTSGHSDLNASRCAAELFGPSSNVTVLERPLRVTTLTSALHSALRARRRQFQVRDLLQQREQVLTSIQDAYAMIDDAWRFTYVNSQACELCQKRPDQLLGRSVWNLFPGANRSEFETNLRLTMQERVARSFEWCDPASHRWFHVRLYPSDGGLALYSVEITDRKRMEAVIEESEQRLHLALDSSDLGTWYCDLPFDKIRWDSTCKRHFGIAPDADVDLDRFFSLLHPEDREPARKAIDRAIADCGNYDIEYRVIHPDGSIHWIHAIGRVFCIGDIPSRFDGITIDVTERKRTEIELERARHEAIEANRAKDQFLAALSHELRTPLNPVLMTVDALKSDPDLPHWLRPNIEMIHRQVELEARLIDDLLDLTRITRDKLILCREVVDLHELIRHAIETSCSGENPAKRPRMDCRLEAREHYTYGDPARLQQILWNLLNNAIKFTPPQGRIIVSTRNTDEGGVEIEITDNGIGIHPEALPRLFDAFEQGNAGITRRFGGLGLGLAISKAVADLHDGSLTASSEGAGKGSRFSLRLRTCTPEEKSSAAPRSGDTIPAPALNVLLVEDHEPTRDVLILLLSRAGHRVKAAETVADALELASRHRFDIVVSDLGLPDASGLELMRKLRKHHGLQGIALSGFGMEEDVKASADAGFHVHLTKPVDWRRLEAALASHVARTGGRDGAHTRSESRRSR